MGEYYDLVNIEKKELLSPNYFELSPHITGSSVKGCDFMLFVYELISSDWKGDHLIWLGDQGSVPNNTGNIALQKIYDQSAVYGYPGDAFDLVYDTYKNISDAFIKNKKLDSDFITCASPVRKGLNFKYVINHTKRFCYDTNEVEVFYSDGSDRSYLDPLLLLLRFEMDGSTGEWVGDIIDVADDVPEGYELKSRLHLEY